MELTVGETAAVEDLAKQPIQALQDATAPKGKLIAALVTVIKRREDPGYTIDEAYTLPASEAGQLVETFFGAADPLPSGGPTSSPRSASRPASPRARPKRSR